jgi:hypothetical protein
MYAVLDGVHLADLLTESQHNRERMRWLPQTETVLGQVARHDDA